LKSDSKIAHFSAAPGRTIILHQNMAAESTFEDILSNSDVGKPQNWPKVDESVRHAWEAEQLQLKSKLSTVDSNLHLPLRFIGGVDLSFSLEDENVACACVVILSHPDLKVYCLKFVNRAISRFKKSLSTCGVCVHRAFSILMTGRLLKM
jgi:hypothetical protein